MSLDLAAWLSHSQPHHLHLRSVFSVARYPGIISSNTLPGGGTTDYAVEIFHAALTTQHYKCFLSPDTRLPFLYMPDCLAATYQLLAAEAACLTQVTSFATGNLAFTAAFSGQESVQGSVQI